MMVKEFEPLASACLYIAMDLARESNFGQGRQATLEYAARIAASIARFTCFNNIRTRMVGAGSRRVEVDGGSGAIQYQRILDELAVVDSDGSLPYASVLEDIATRSIDGETVVVFLSQQASESIATLQRAYDAAWQACACFCNRVRAQQFHRCRRAGGCASGCGRGSPAGT